MDEVAVPVIVAVEVAVPVAVGVPVIVVVIDGDAPLAADSKTVGWKHAAWPGDSDSE